jgi:MoxR-like ATPase
MDLPESRDTPSSLAPLTMPGAARPTEAAQLGTRFQEAARILNNAFLDKQEIIRLLIISAIAGEHMILVGPPGTAKSALIRTFAQLVDARYFEYLLTRFTEPNEIFGPVDIKLFREGRYTRRTEKMLPDAEIVFLDEIFKSNSAILNALLGILNERRFANGADVQRVPLLSMFAAANLRVVSENLDSYHFHNLVQKGLENEVRRASPKQQKPVISAHTLHQLHSETERLQHFPEDFLAKYKGLIFQIRSEGISVSDRRVVKLLKLFAASALFEGRADVCDGDFFVLRHIWNNLDQAELLEEIVNPVVDAYYRDRPTERRFLGPQASLDDLLAELRLIRELFTGDAELSDIQLFSQLKNLNEIKAALQAISNDTARRMLAEVDQLLETVFASSKFGG